MIELETIVGIAAFSLILPAFVLQLLCNQSSILNSVGAYSASLAANSKLQGADASFASTNLTLSQAQDAMHALFGNGYVLNATSSAEGTSNQLVSRILVIGNRPYYIRVYQYESTNSS